MVPLAPHLNPCGPKSNGREAGVFCVHETHPRLGLSLWQKDRAALVWDILQFPEMVVHEDTPHPPLGFCAGIWGPTWGNKDILPSGHYSIRATMEDQAEWVSQTKPEQPPWASGCRQKEGGSECDLYCFSFFVPHMQNVGCAEQMFCW